MDRHAAHRRGPDPADPAPAFAGRPAAAGYPGSAWILGPDLSRSAQGNEGTLSEASVARKSLECSGDSSGQTTVTRKASRPIAFSRPLRRDVGSRLGQPLAARNAMAT